VCSDEAVRRYLARISGPLLDRIDIHLDVPAVAWCDLADPTPAEPSAAVRGRVMGARARQAGRNGSQPPVPNAHLGVHGVRRWCAVTPEGRRLLEQAMQRLALSARAHMRILKLARTIADLAGVEGIEIPHLAEAIQYRGLDRSGGAAGVRG
jgi:magnesium chelatase family protein